MADEVFKVEQATEGFVHFRHIAERHLYVFQVTETEGGRRLASVSRFQQDDGAPHSAEYFLNAAQLFAEDYFRRTGQVD
jgi:hypothetical protein